MAVVYQNPNPPTPAVCFLWGLSVGAFLVALLCAAVAFGADGDGADLPIGPKRLVPTLPSPLDQLDPPHEPGDVPPPLKEPPPPKIPVADWFGEKIPIPSGAVFIIDRSGSMVRAATMGYFDGHGHHVKGLTRLEIVIAETKRMLEALPDNAKFDLVEFSDSGSALWHQPREASDGNLAEAFVWLDALYPNGGTETGAHTAWALQHSGYVSIADFFLLSDGAPNDPKGSLVLILAADGSRTKVHAYAFTLNNVPAEKFMQDVGALTGGTYRLVKP